MRHSRPYARAFHPIREPNTNACMVLIFMLKNLFGFFYIAAVPTPHHTTCLFVGWHWHHFPISYCKVKGKAVWL